ncbi:hypothetical protein [Micromonospora sp. RTP1Z1]|uniref:hypothetical protein n=1 Tax=Micromonospora sp. RTP1Z1 TaxID=2994043 RepID=UPI0029C711A9|nr:hypothetical protein [Micromonospora sp. RTP1Z1]
MPTQEFRSAISIEVSARDATKITSKSSSSRVAAAGPSPDRRFRAHRVYPVRRGLPPVLATIQAGGLRQRPSRCAD